MVNSPIEPAGAGPAPREYAWVLAPSGVIIGSSDTHRTRMAMTALDARIHDIYASDAAPLRASVARAAGGDLQLAEDVAQESWLRAILYWPAQGVPDRPGAWLRTVSRNILFNERRRRPTVNIDDADPAALRAPDMEAKREQLALHDTLHAALAELPSDGRGLVESHYFGGQPLGEIARNLGVSERAVEGRLRRARLRLRSVLEMRGVSNAELRGLAVPMDISLVTIGKVLLMSTLLPILVAVAGYFVARRLHSQRSDRQRTVGYLVSGLGLFVMGLVGGQPGRPLQLFGLGMVLYGSWRVMRQRWVQASG